MLRKRLFGFLIDYLVILSYIAVLVAISLFFFPSGDLENTGISPLNGEIISFFTLTMPVFLYFYLLEIREGTLGKRRMNISVEGEKNRIFLRNVFKFLPWEMAHVGVHWLWPHVQSNTEPPLWVWICLIAAQVFAIGYIISLLVSGGKSTIYDRLAKTKVVLKS